MHVQHALKAIAVTACAVVLAAAMNPGIEQHRLAFKGRFAELNPVAGALGVGALASTQQHYHSVGVMSYTEVGRRVATIGMFNMVFVVIPDSELDIR